MITTGKTEREWVTATHPGGYAAITLREVREFVEATKDYGKYTVVKGTHRDGVDQLADLASISIQTLKDTP